MSFGTKLKCCCKNYPNSIKNLMGASASQIGKLDAKALRKALSIKSENVEMPIINMGNDSQR